MKIERMQVLNMINQELDTLRLTAAQAADEKDFVVRQMTKSYCSAGVEVLEKLKLKFENLTE